MRLGLEIIWGAVKSHNNFDHVMSFSRHQTPLFEMNMSRMTNTLVLPKADREH